MVGCVLILWVYDRYSIVVFYLDLLGIFWIFYLKFNIYYFNCFYYRKFKCEVLYFNLKLNRIELYLSYFDIYILLWFDLVFGIFIYFWYFKGV